MTAEDERPEHRAAYEHGNRDALVAVAARLRALATEAAGDDAAEELGLRAAAREVDVTQEAVRAATAGPARRLLADHRGHLRPGRPHVDGQ